MPQKGVLLFSGTLPQTGCTCGTRHIPALVHVANRPIAHHVLDAMTAAGVDELILAGTADVLLDVRACLLHYDPPLPAKLDYAISGESSDTIAALRAAAPLVGNAPCIVHLGDGLLDEPLAPYIAALEQSSLDLLLLCRQASDPTGPAAAPRRDLGPRPSRGLDCDGGIAVFGHGALSSACRADDSRELSRLDVLAQHLSDEGRHVGIRLVEGWRRYSGSPRDLLEVNRLALDMLAPPVRQAPGDDVRIEGRVHIHPGASVRASVIVGPVVLGEGAEVADAYIGPYTSIGAGARIEGAEIERSIISPGATVMHVGARLVSSLVGRGAHVFRDFSLPRALRLHVGAGDEVALC